MSGTSSVTNTFQSQTGDIPLSQLDENYTDLTDYLNDPTNRNNYAVASGASTYAITLSPPATGGYTAGLEVTWQAASANTAAVALNVNGLGAAPLLYPDSAAVSVVGVLAAGGVYKAVYNGSAFIYQGNSAFIPSAATQAQQQTATATGVYVNSAIQHFHPSAMKAGAFFSGTHVATGTFDALFSYNVATINKRGTSTWSITFINSFASTNYIALANYGATVGANILAANVQARSTTGCLIIAGTPDPQNMNFVVYGVLA